MKKESLIAIVLGLVFGLIFAIFIVAGLSQSRLEKGKILVSEKKEVTLSPAKKINFELLTIDKPNNNIIITKDQITIEGSADKDSLIVIQSPIKDLVFQNKDKKFKVDFPLALGENVIKIVAYPKLSNIKIQEKTLFIYYLPNEI
jgi:hypothetical protein